VITFDKYTNSFILFAQHISEIGLLAFNSLLPSILTDNLQTLTVIYFFRLL